jgi:uncharacterized SAM-binding protein YcdF (DUF218 family)
MFLFLSKFLPPFIYPVGLTCLLLALAVLLGRRPRWQTRLTAAALAVLWLGGNRIVTMALLRSLEWQYTPATIPGTPPPQADVIVVLGGGTRARAFPRTANEINEAGDRLLCAARLYQQGAAPRILLSGGNVPWLGPASTPEAEAMADILVAIGVPRDAIWTEPASRNTHENAVETQAFLESQGIDDVILVTSALHMPRAYGVFAKTDLDVTPVPADYLVTQADWEHHTQPDLVIQLINLLPRAENLHWTTSALKEYVGIWIYGLRGWL